MGLKKKLEDVFNQGDRVSSRQFVFRFEVFVELTALSVALAFLGFVLLKIVELLTNLHKIVEELWSKEVDRVD